MMHMANLSDSALHFFTRGMHLHKEALLHLCTETGPKYPQKASLQLAQVTRVCRLK